jgi:hypothetical protein
MDLIKKSSADYVIEYLLGIDVDGETMEYIINGTHLKTQMLRQLVLQSSDSDINSLLEEKIILNNKHNEQI